MEEQGLPESILKDLENKEQAQMKHRWAFSFMPVDKRFTDRDRWRTDVFLVGYCQVCDTSVSSPVELGYSTTVTEARIPKWGCIPKQELD